MEARDGQEETSPIVPSSLPSIDFLTDRNRRDCWRFLLNLNEVNRSVALPNWKNDFKLLK